MAIQLKAPTAAQSVDGSVYRTLMDHAAKNTDIASENAMGVLDAFRKADAVQSEQLLSQAETPDELREALALVNPTNSMNSEVLKQGEAKLLALDAQQLKEDELQFDRDSHSDNLAFDYAKLKADKKAESKKTKALNAANTLAADKFKAEQDKRKEADRHREAFIASQRSVANLGQTIESGSANQAATKLLIERLGEDNPGLANDVRIQQDTAEQVGPDGKPTIGAQIARQGYDTLQRSIFNAIGDTGTFDLDIALKYYGVESLEDLSAAASDPDNGIPRSVPLMLNKLANNPNLVAQFSNSLSDIRKEDQNKLAEQNLIAKAASIRAKENFEGLSAVAKASVKRQTDKAVKDVDALVSNSMSFAYGGGEGIIEALKKNFGTDLDKASDLTAFLGVDNIKGSVGFMQQHVAKDKAFIRAISKVTASTHNKKDKFMFNKFVNGLMDKGVASPKHAEILAKKLNTKTGAISYSEKELNDIAESYEDMYSAATKKTREDILLNINIDR